MTEIKESKTIMKTENKQKIIMKTFLEYVAIDLIDRFGTDLSKVAVVFPNKRASLFLNEYIAQYAGKPVWSPAYITISDLFRSQSQLVVADPIKLVCDLYKTYVEVTKSDESLDHFYGWGQVMLADFDDIDKNMAEADKVFCNMRDLHELDDVSYLTPEQVELIRKFFSNFNSCLFVFHRIINIFIIAIFFKYSHILCVSILHLYRHNSPFRNQLS